MTTRNTTQNTLRLLWF